MAREALFNADKDPWLELREKVDVGAASLPNEKIPETNEDALLIDQSRMLFGVFDSSGGRSPGGITSRVARDLVEGRAGELAPEMSPPDEADALSEILKDVSEDMSLRSAESDRSAPGGAGATAVLLKLLRIGESVKAAVAHVSDSRLYRLPAQAGLSQAGELEEITLDDSPVRDQFHDKLQAREVQRKLANVSNLRTLSIHELNLFASRNRVSQRLGRMQVAPHTQTLDVESGDIFILTTDGVHDNLTDKEIEAICRSSSGGREAAERLTENARSRSRESKEQNPRANPDAMSAVVVRIGEF